MTSFDTRAAGRPRYCAAFWHWAPSPAEGHLGRDIDMLGMTMSADHIAGAHVRQDILYVHTHSIAELRGMCMRLRLRVGVHVCVRVCVCASVLVCACSGDTSMLSNAQLKDAR